jgi:uncharacterized membrane protein YsdA (DUF1294 family)
MWTIVGFVIYFVIASFVAYAVMAHDKKAAKRKDWRIKESTLLTIAALGGSVGMFVAMHRLRHKTKHPKFTIGVPLIILFQFVLMVVIIYLINR